MISNFKVTIFVMIAFVFALGISFQQASAANFVSDISLYVGKSKSSQVPEDSSRDLNVSTERAQISFGWLEVPYESSTFWGINLGYQRDVFGGVRSEGEWFGVGLGYFFESGFRLRGFYNASTSFASQSGGDGALVEVGWWRPISSKFSLGLNMNYQSVNFVRPSASFNSIYPALVIGGFF